MERKEYYQKNKEHLCALARLYYDRNSEERLENMAVYYKEQ